MSRSLETPLDVLVVAPHPDDAEISVGGTIAACRAAGRRVGVLDLTDGEPTPRGTVERRQSETAAATEVLDLTWRQQLGLPNRRLQADLDARRKLAEMMRLTRPRVVLAPYWEDSHPDHVAASQLVDAATFWAKLSRTDLAGEPYHPKQTFYYWSIHLRIRPTPSFVFDISPWIEKKLEAIRCYTSQFEGRSEEFPTALEDIRDRARYWGWAIHAAYGEPFASREAVRITSFDSVLTGR